MNAETRKYAQTTVTCKLFASGFPRLTAHLPRPSLPPPFTTLVAAFAASSIEALSAVILTLFSPLSTRPAPFAKLVKGPIATSPLTSMWVPAVKVAIAIDPLLPLLVSTLLTLPSFLFLLLRLSFTMRAPLVGLPFMMAFPMPRICPPGANIILNGSQTVWHALFNQAFTHLLLRRMGLWENQELAGMVSILEVEEVQFALHMELGFRQRFPVARP